MQYNSITFLLKLALTLPLLVIDTVCKISSIHCLVNWHFLQTLKMKYTKHPFIHVTFPLDARCKLTYIRPSEVVQDVFWTLFTFNLRPVSGSFRIYLKLCVIKTLLFHTHHEQYKLCIFVSLQICNFFITISEYSSSCAPNFSL